MGTFFFLVSTNDIYTEEVNHIQTNGVNDLPLFTNLSVAVLGTSHLSSDISSALNTSTSNITYAADLDELVSIGSVKVLIIDGAWLVGQASKDVSEAIGRFFLNRTAIAVVNGPSDALTSVLRTTNPNESFSSSSSASYAICCAPNANGAVCLELENPKAYHSTIVLYNWCVSQEARL
jgi:hypothetical protein